MIADLDPESFAEMRRLWRAGERPWVIAERFALTPAEVRWACDTRGVIARRRREAREALARQARRARARDRDRNRSKALARRDAKIRRLWSEGESGARLADRFGLAPSTISGIVSGLARPRPHDRRDAELRRLWAEGESGWDLVAWSGLSRSRVSEIVSGRRRARRYGDPWEVASPYPRRRAPDPAPSRRFPLPRVDPPGPDDALPALRPGRLGSSNGRAKLDEACVSRLRRLRAEGWTYPALAREFGIARSNVFYILSGKTWAKEGGG